MLADLGSIAVSGSLEPSVIPSGFGRRALIRFIENQLVDWRDDPERLAVSSERILVHQLCLYLNVAAHQQTGWDRFFFKTESPDEMRPGRSIDLTVSPKGSMMIDGRSFSKYDTLLPIECKRLPTPSGDGRDEREYVITETGSTGGIQRFKFGYHGGSHGVGAIIAFVQSNPLSTWMEKINSWIDALASEDGSRWELSDQLRRRSYCNVNGIHCLESSHWRSESLGPIDLDHIWIDMAPRQETSSEISSL